jgi:hypothetical protein
LNITKAIKINNNNFNNLEKKSSLILLWKNTGIIEHNITDAEIILYLFLL